MPQANKLLHFRGRLLTINNKHCTILLYLYLYAYDKQSALTQGMSVVIFETLKMFKTKTQAALALSKSSYCFLHSRKDISSPNWNVEHRISISRPWTVRITRRRLSGVLLWLVALELHRAILANIEINLTEWIWWKFSRISCWVTQSAHYLVCEYLKRMNSLSTGLYWKTSGSEFMHQQALHDQLLYLTCSYIAFLNMASQSSPDG